MDVVFVLIAIIGLFLQKRLKEYDWIIGKINWVYWCMAAWQLLVYKHTDFQSITAALSLATCILIHIIMSIYVLKVSTEVSNKKHKIWVLLCMMNFMTFITNTIPGLRWDLESVISCFAIVMGISFPIQFISYVIFNKVDEKKRNIMMIILLCVVLACICGLIYYYFNYMLKW